MTSCGTALSATPLPIRPESSFNSVPPEERRKMVERPDGPGLFAHLRDLPAPLPVADVQDYLRSHGMPPHPV
ncbi:MAG: hypothetical protein F4037_14155 [Gemmatimonadales bacterium]|nr:hypothetical protein [Candidatus Palauibacter ramosifaciens]